MFSKKTILRITAALAVGACASSQAPPPASAPTSAAPSTPPSSAKLAGLQRRDGFIPFFLDSRQGRIYLEIPRDSMRALMFVSLATGLGSNPIGLDRGAGGDSYVTRFDRSGDHVLVVFENWNYRSSASDNPAHLRTVLEAFPPSTVAALPISKRRCAPGSSLASGPGLGRVSRRRGG